MCGTSHVWRYEPKVRIRYGWLAHALSLDALSSAYKRKLFTGLVTKKQGDVGRAVNFELADLVGADCSWTSRSGMGCIFGCTDTDYWSCGDDGGRP